MIFDTHAHYNDEAFDADREALLTALPTQPRMDPGAVEIGREPVCHNPRCITQTEHYLPPLVKQNGGVDCCAYCDKELR